MTGNELTSLVEKQFGKVGKDTVYVWADTYAQTFLEKMKFPFVKGQYVLVLERNKLHILTINPEKSTNKVTEETTYTITDLRHISIGNLWSQKNPVAKMITFNAPTGEKHKYRVPYEAHEFEHKDQKKHLLSLIDSLMPSK